MDIFYDPRQNVDDNVSFSPSGGKPKHVVASWKSLGIPLRFPAFDPVTPADLKLAHDAGYVDGVLAGRLQNGFGNTLWAVFSPVRNCKCGIGLCSARSTKYKFPSPGTWPGVTRSRCAGCSTSMTPRCRNAWRSVKIDRYALRARVLKFFCVSALQFWVG